MVQYSGKDYKYVQEALQYLEKFTPHHLRVFSFATSDYHFGHKLPFHYDRCHVEFHSHSLYQDPVKAQIVFDSSNYTFPPDIIFLNPAALPNVEPQAWLPTDWDITAKTCLVEWLQHIEELLFQGTSRKLSVPDIMAVDSEEDRSESLSVRTGASVEPVRSPSHGTVTRRVSNSGSHPSSILPHAEMVEFRRSFIQQCLMQYNDHVIRYDDKEFFSISLYLTVKIPSDLFQELQEYHCQAVQQRPEPKVAKARQEAPVIVSRKKIVTGHLDGSYFFFFL
ncbi:uncharacterized protein BYT42DRAFT_577245, partial [Radiomyces spectabilis]|uniref:uncharacterized protein n=1 Tax=Radiomyces spectabilis TaxID=64574 RepID=UPI00221E3C79